jgi:hypothetical protein
MYIYVIISVLYIMVPVLYINVILSVIYVIAPVLYIYVIIPLLYGIVPVLYIYSLILVLYGIVQVLCIIHLLHASEGNMNIYSPTSIIFPEGNWGQHPRGIWYSWVNKCSYFLNPHAINVLLYRMKPRKHIHVEYCWQTYFKFIEMLSQTFKNHIHNNKEIQDQYPRENNLAYAFRVPLTFSCQKKITLVLCDHVFWFLPIVQSN